MADIRVGTIGSNPKFFTYFKGVFFSFFLMRMFIYLFIYLSNYLFFRFICSFIYLFIHFFSHSFVLSVSYFLLNLLIRILYFNQFLGFMYYQADDGIHGSELWRDNGGIISSFHFFFLFPFFFFLFSFGYFLLDIFLYSYTIIFSSTFFSLPFFEMFFL